ncbi:MAG: hypothetical protein QOI59_244 [Gammaproteobacteria bacterium]|nr:hypothetical protein [Gammaproteobacteria bacterium]
MYHHRQSACLLDVAVAMRPQSLNNFALLIDTENDNEFQLKQFLCPSAWRYTDESSAVRRDACTPFETCELHTTRHALNHTRLARRQTGSPKQACGGAKEARPSKARSHSRAAQTQQVHIRGRAIRSTSYRALSLPPSCTFTLVGTDWKQPSMGPCGRPVVLLSARRPSDGHVTRPFLSLNNRDPRVKQRIN